MFSCGRTCPIYMASDFDDELKAFVVGKPEPFTYKQVSFFSEAFPAFLCEPVHADVCATPNYPCPCPMP